MPIYIQYYVSLGEKKRMEEIQYPVQYSVTTGIHSLPWWGVRGAKPPLKLKRNGRNGRNGRNNGNSY
jgi:hypothetical protein